MRNVSKVVASFPAYDIVAPKVCSLTNLPVFKADETVALKGPRVYSIFTFGSVASFAMEMNDCPIESYQRALEKGHKTHWLNANAVTLSAGKRDKETHYEINVGDEILFEGFVFRVEKDWNNNLKLVKVETKRERMNRAYNEAS